MYTASETASDIGDGAVAVECGKHSDIVDYQYLCVSWLRLIVELTVSYASIGAKLLNYGRNVALAYYVRRKYVLYTVASMTQISVEVGFVGFPCASANQAFASAAIVGGISVCIIFARFFVFEFVSTESQKFLNYGVGWCLQSYGFHSVKPSVAALRYG